MSAVKLEEIKYEKLIPGCAEQLMLGNEIPGAKVTHYSLRAGEVRSFAPDKTFIRIFFLCKGNAAFSSNGKYIEYAEKAVYTDLPDCKVEVSAVTDCSFIEIRWDLNDEDIAELNGAKNLFPFTEAYEDAVQYRDPFKSESTISRAIIKQGIIPRFALGSVETVGDDLIGQHAHPLLDQFFFSFPENDMNLLVDCRIFPMVGDTLLHIPMGSNHGVLCLGKQKVHYIWMDFVSPEQKKAAVAFLDEMHKPTGVIQNI